MKNQNLKQSSVLAVLVLFLLTFSASCTYAYKGIRGNGKVVKQERSVSSFTGIDVGGAFKVFLTQGDKESIVVEADENLLDAIDTEVRGKTLNIDTNEDIKDSEALNIYITFVNLEDLDISGACQLTGENKFKLNNLKVECSGASDVSLKMSASNVDLDCSGASKFDIYGMAESLVFDISGASNMDASDFEVKVCEADVSGASNGKVKVTGELSADVSGAGSLKYAGDPVIKHHDVSGAGSLRKI
ncbi:MAG: DUF2807 domain-containing protein [Bacteroidales bacterium]|nr:DUF2807 domain-containing protein [Bacteroidales bacterium]MCF8402386.1 DUF2807 domain-containing protein [Bacteroidales bacterium]